MASEWHLAGSVSDFETGQGREVVIDSQIIAVFRTPSGWFAVDGMCAHQGGPLAQGQVDGKCVTCPWHGWQYDVSTGCNLLTGKSMLSQYAVEERDSGVWVRVQ